MRGLGIGLEHFAYLDIEKHQKEVAAVQQEIEKTKARIEELEAEKSNLLHETSWDKETLRELEERYQRRHITSRPLADEEEK